VPSPLGSKQLCQKPAADRLATFPIPPSNLRRDLPRHALGADINTPFSAIPFDGANANASGAYNSNKVGGGVGFNARVTLAQPRSVTTYRRNEQS